MKFSILPCFVAGLILYFFTPAMAQLPIVDQWKMVTQKPSEGWQKPDFDDSQWPEHFGGFGTRGTPGARVGTNWTTNDIWLRKSFELATVPENPALLIHHDEDAEVFINGEEVATFSRWTSEYITVPLKKEYRSTLKTGMNVLAVHCRQATGGQFIDVHLVDADKIPNLPPAKRDPSPFKSELITSWGADVSPENAWTEYPRPQLERSRWLNLNGHWDYSITSEEQTVAPANWSEKILVPFALESKLGGVQRFLEPNEALWYRRSFDLTPSGRTLLNFEAVDYLCEAFVNGKSVGTHQGGNTPFTFDITSACHAGENELVVRVEDDTEGWQLRGKQTLDPNGIWYTQVSGIWQTVWIEQVTSSYIEDLKIQTNAADGVIEVTPKIVGRDTVSAVRIAIKDAGIVVAESIGKGETTSIQVKEPKLWSPDSPQLYELDVTLLDSNGKELDRVSSYTGIRTVGKERDKNGHLRFTLNGNAIFHWGPLDQGWWPDGLLTPPSDEAMLFDIEWLKSAGFNMIRKHIKVEPRRYYYHCDRLGMMVWQDQVSAGHNPPWTRLDLNPKDADWSDEHHQQFMLELERMIDNLENHPSIVVWVPFNEAWGQHRTVEVGKWTVKRDPSRIVNIASGGNFWPIGDVVDHHAYPHPEFPFDPERYDAFVKVMGEFGGHGYPVVGHLWDANRDNWGYGGLPKNEEEYKERYAISLQKLNELRGLGIAAGVYTQTTDVEGEINGLMTYDRKVIKIPAEKLSVMHGILFEN